MVSGLLGHSGRTAHKRAEAVLGSEPGRVPTHQDIHVANPV